MSGRTPPAAAGPSQQPRFQVTRRQQLEIRLSRLLRWEFWPSWAFYPPIVIYIFARSARARPFMAVTAANPCLQASGIVGETKHDALDPLQANAPEYAAEFTLLPAAWPLAQRIEALHAFIAAGPGYPVVLKPDIGQRGRGVAVIRNDAQATDYLAGAEDDVIAQRHVAGSEYGVFVYRDPATARVEILSIVNKCFPSVTGNGRHTLGELILADARARLIAPGLFQRWARQLDAIPAAGEVLPLVEIGAHCRGSLFLDGNHLRSEPLRLAMTAILDAVPGYHFGRLDLRCPDEAHLLAGRGLKVLEMNGVTAESAHIYHPGTPLIDGWRAMIRQWRIAIEIGEANAAAGARTIGFIALLKLWRADLARGKRWF
ncbi:MAG: hypothetical protein NTZ11_17190 [Gammaproteobacteria bacterium]|nr:hypothetical protein [Gammaproteobacteria bacterium]